MSYIKQIVDSIADDKKDHLVVGTIYALSIIPIALISFFIGGFPPMIIFSSISAGIGTYFNLWKELYYDWYLGKGNPEFWDFIATQIPILLVYLPILALYLYSINIF